MRFATSTLPNPEVAKPQASPLDPNQPEFAAALKRLAESAPQTR